MLLALLVLSLVASSLAALDFDFCRNRPNGNFPDPVFPCSSLFIRCWGGEMILERCRVPGDRFDVRFSNDSKCQPKEMVDACKPITSAPTPPSTPPPQVITSAPTPPSTPPPQVITSAPTPRSTPPSPEFTCKSRRNGDYKLPGSGCTNKFARCLDGELTESTCKHPFFRFEGEDGHGRCQPASQVSACRPPFSCEGRRNGNYPKPDADPCSNKFIRCSEGKSMESICRRRTWRFSSELSRCLPKMFLSECNRPVAPAPPVEKDEFNCSSKDGIHPDPKVPCSTWFWMCSSGAATRQDCAGKTFFDVESTSCLAKRYVKACGGTPTPKAEPFTKSPDKQHSIDFDCSSEFDGFYGSPEEECSSKYVGCSGGAMSVMICPANLKYDVETNMCLHKRDIRACGGNPPTKPTTPLLAPPSTFAPGTMEFHCSGQESGLFEDPENPCSAVYYKCSRGVATKLLCPLPATNRFDVLSGRCLSEDLVLWCKF